jgi:hypothetical protein
MKLIKQEIVNKAAESYADTKDYDWDIAEIDFINGCEFAETQLSELVIEFLDSIRDYERENGQRICFDDRSSKELFEMFIKKRNNE